MKNHIFNYKIDLWSTCSEILKCLNFVTKLYLRQSSKWKYEFTGQNHILELIYIYIYLNKIWKIYWSEQSFLVCNQYRKRFVSSPPVFSGVRVVQSLVFCVVFCRSLFVLLYFFHLAIVLYVLHRFMDSDYPFDIFRLFLLVRHTRTWLIFSWYSCFLWKWNSWSQSWQ